MVGSSDVEVGLDRDMAILEDKSILQAESQQESNGTFFKKEFNKAYQKDIVHE